METQRLPVKNRKIPHLSRDPFFVQTRVPRVCGMVCRENSTLNLLKRDQINQQRHNIMMHIVTCDLHQCMRRIQQFSNFEHYLKLQLKYQEKTLFITRFDDAGRMISCIKQFLICVTSLTSLLNYIDDL